MVMNFIMNAIIWTLAFYGLFEIHNRRNKQKQDK